ncbi:hypothetical protein TrLO_g3367 [Triparma laevis f. longispina]|uniref:Uncharacterized protein n=1 Tax=Triparma laevis f. longispina TaxID=1714387 RepID=A0A9W7EE56_9STRA|nr:hypothetical protein TrLO_g3367 [Triparma laevis f. longispina]
MTLRLVTKAWKRVADAFIDEGVESGEIMVHDGYDISSIGGWKYRRERRKLATRVIFLLNITKVGQHECHWAVNLFVVDIPEGVQRFGHLAFRGCSSLTTISFPTTLTFIGGYAFCDCSSLDNVDLLHTNLQKIGGDVFWDCSELKSMTIPDSLQTLGCKVFTNCFKLVPSSIDVSEDNDVDLLSPEVVLISEVVTRLRSLQNS